MKQLADAVKATLGPRGRTVLIEKYNQAPVSTKDGVTVAKEIYLEDKFENMGARVVKDAANKTNDDAGDGPQPLYAKIATPDGFVKMGDLNVGDKICGTNNTIQDVVGVYPKGEKEVFKVVFADGREVECCEDHLWEITNYYGKREVMTVKAMIKKGVYRITPNQERKFNFYTPVTSVDFSKNELSLDPYLLGVLLGDGCFSKKGSIELSLGLKKKHIIEKLKLPDNIQMKSTLVETSHSYRVKFSMIDKKGKSMHSYIEDIGLLNTGSSTKYIPENYLFSSLEDREALLQGLTDTDGYKTNRRLLEYSTISNKLNDDVLLLLRSLGITATSSLHTREKDNSYSKTPIHRIRQLKGYKYGNKIKEIKATGKSTEMQCIKVSNSDNLYVTNDFVITHNTTTSTILTEAILKEGNKYVTSGSNPVLLKRGIDKAVDLVVAEIEKTSIGITTKEQIKAIATISANNDEVIGDLITKAMDAVGNDGVITVGKSNYMKTCVELTDGLQIKKGYLSPYFCTDQVKMECDYENPYILIYDGILSNLKPFTSLFEEVVAKGKPLFIVANDVEGSALSALILNSLRQTIKVCAIQAPSFSDNRREGLQDLAALVGASFISPELGDIIEETSIEDMGTAKRVIVSKDKAIIVDGDTDKERYDFRVAKVKEMLKTVDNDFEKEKMQERLAMLTGGVAVIKVGANTEVEASEKKDRVQDSLSATRSAIEEGIVLGGGMCLFNAREVLLKKKFKTQEEKAGFDIVYKALEYPLLTIAENAGIKGEVIASQVASMNGLGYNALTEKWEDFTKSGILDPAKVERVALQNAASIAGTLLTTEVVIVEKPMDNNFMQQVKPMM